jgi:ADP-L-glycero-D-manno-heptose 6-epimerase
MPDDLKGKYQYFTQADISKLRHAGFTEAFHTLEDGVRDYVQNYLMQPDPYC